MMSLLDKVFPPKEGQGATSPANTQPKRPLGQQLSSLTRKLPSVGSKAEPVPRAPSSAAGIAPAELMRRRDALAAQVAELHWDLGGLVYEMSIRDHFRMDVLVRQAARLQELDAQLAKVERLIRTESEGAAGSCPSCGAPHSRGAVFCWQCGEKLLEQAKSTAI